MSNLKVNICGVDFKNPIIPASGTFGFGKEYMQFYDISKLGGLCTKGTTLAEKQGNPAPRIAEANMAMLNSVGLQNPGVDYFVSRDLQILKKIDTRVIANIAGSTVEDYQKMAEKMSVDGVDMIEMNISCPNVKAGGMAFGVYPENVADIVKAVRPYCKKPLIVKLSPNVADIAENAKAAEANGADCISLINTLSGMVINYKTRKPVLANVQGGMSGPALKPIALKMVWQCFNAVKIPIIGLGGITCYKDVLEFMICGARAVEVGTANIMNPMACSDIIDDLQRYVDEQNMDINDLVGTLITE